MKQNNKGFTLLESGIVVVILILLGCLAIPACQKIRDTSKARAEGRRDAHVEGAGLPFIIESGPQHIGSNSTLYVVRHKETGHRFVVTQDAIVLLPPKP